MAFDKDKFKRLVHYVIWRAGENDGFGATKLNKVLWFADARAYVLNGKPITGATYVRERHGPSPREFMPIRHELEREGKIRLFEPSGDDEHGRFKAIEPADPSLLSDDERQIVEYWLKHIDEDHTATSTSEKSHDYPWEIAEVGATIPLQAFFATRVREPAGDELIWAKRVAEKLSLP